MLGVFDKYAGVVFGVGVACMVGVGDECSVFVFEVGVQS